MAKRITDKQVNEILRAMRFKTEAEAMTDGELARALINEVWAHGNPNTRPTTLVDEAITRLERADIRRRWQERKEKRAARRPGYWCDNCGDLTREEVKQEERDECCVYVCRRCDAIADEPIPF